MLKVPGCDYKEIEDVEPHWENMTGDQLAENLPIGRCRHSSVAFQDKIYSFGGCYMYDKKRQVRECTEEVTVYDTISHSYKLIKTKGMNVIPRKDHCAAVFG